MFNDDPKNVYLYPSITHSINRSMYLFLCLFDSRSFMQCSRFCLPHAMGGRRCAVPPNPPPAFWTQLYQKYISIRPSIIQSINLTICLFVFLFIYESRSASLHRQLPIFPFSRDYLYFSIGFSTFLHTILYISLFNSLCFAFLFRSCYISL